MLKITLFICDEYIHLIQFTNFLNTGSLFNIMSTTNKTLSMMFLEIKKPLLKSFISFCHLQHLCWSEGRRTEPAKLVLS